MKTRIILYLTIIIGSLMISCNDNYISEETGRFLRTNHQKIEIRVGERFTLTPMYDSDETAAKNYTWSIIDQGVASVIPGVNDTGVVEGIAPGNTIIELKSSDNELTYYIDVKVTSDAPAVRILAIGNSFSEDAIENYFYDLAVAGGHNVIIGNMYIGGSGLSLHWENAIESKPNYQFRKIEQNGVLSRLDSWSIYQAITSENWDYISFQEVSQNSGLIEGYEEFLPQLVEFAKRFGTNPDKKIILHQTWAYAVTSNHEGFDNYNRDQETMYNAIVDAVNKTKATGIIDLVVPSGTAIQNGRTSYLGDRFTRDGYHLDLGIGRFTAASAWYEAIFGGIIENPFYPENLLKYDTELAKQAAHDAVNEPMEVTELVAYKERGPNEFVLEVPLFIDFGPKFSPAPFNNFARWQDGSVTGLKDEDGNNTDFIIKTGIPFHDGVIDRFMPNLLGLPLTASQDAFFHDGRVVPDGSSVILSNLNNEQKYSFVLYGTINDKGTQSEYVVTGKNQGSGILDTDHNLSKVVVINDIEPDENGDITILIRKGPDATQYWGYYGLNVLIVLPGGTSYPLPENDFKMTDPLIVDFGLEVSGFPFNNYRDAWEPGINSLADPVLNMTDMKGVNTGFAIAMTDGFSAVNNSGAFGNTLGLPDVVAVDAFWGDMWMPDGQLTLSNLNKADKYDFIFYGSRRDVGGNRETVYEVIGQNTGSGSLNAANNNSQVAIVNGIIPDDRGNIIINVRPGPNNDTPERYYYLNTMIFGPEGFDFEGL